MELIKKPKGTKDIIGEDAVKYIYVSNVTQKMFENYGYKFAKTPIFEETELFKRGIGEATDVVEKEMYTFKDKGDRSITLRPENTASMVRCYLENSIYAKEDISRFYYNGSMFRYERPQAGRQREFNQIGVEVFGEKSPILDAEVIAMGYNLLTKLGITDLEVKINSVGSKGSRTIYREKLVEHFKSHLDDMCDDCKDRIDRNPLRLLDCKIDGEKDFYKSAPSIIDFLFEDERKFLQKAKMLMDKIPEKRKNRQQITGNIVPEKEIITVAQAKEMGGYMFREPDNKVLLVKGDVFIQGNLDNQWIGEQLRGMTWEGDLYDVMIMGNLVVSGSIADSTINSGDSYLFLNVMGDVECDYFLARSCAIVTL